MLEYKKVVKINSEPGTVIEASSREAARLRTVLEVGRKVTRILDLDRLLTESVRLIQQTFDFELVTIFLRDQHDPDYFFNSHHSRRSDSYNGKICTRNHISKGMVGWVFRHEQHRLANDVSRDPYYYFSTEQTRAELDLPLKINGQVVGVLGIESTALNAFDPEDVPFLEILADQIATAIENARLTARAREAAIAEERNRLARDLHDDTIQALIGVSRQLDLLRCDLSDEFSDSNLEGTGECAPLPPNVERRLNRLQDSLDRTVQGLRLLSRELQPQLLKDLGLSAAIDALTSDVSRTSNLQITVELAESANSLMLEQQLEVYRIAQEAMANIVKHASASRVVITVDVQENKVMLNIRDDGKGFEVPDDLTNLARRGGMGVLSMRQRACSVGGFLNIKSELGRGTVLSLEMPVVSRETVAS
jgi:signal transduction histidine kinase